MVYPHGNAYYPDKWNVCATVTDTRATITKNNSLRFGKLPGTYRD